MQIISKELEAKITHKVEVVVTLATYPVEEVTTNKYSEITGIPIERVA